MDKFKKTLFVKEGICEKILKKIKPRFINLNPLAPTFMLSSLIKQLSEQFSFDIDLDKDPEGYMLLRIHSNLELFLKELPVGFTCKAEIAPLPLGEQEDLLALLMRANYLGQGTKGGVIALSDTAQKILFFSSSVDQCNYRQFKEKIEEIVNYLNYWKTRVNDETKKR